MGEWDKVAGKAAYKRRPFSKMAKSNIWLEAATEYKAAAVGRHGLTHSEIPQWRLKPEDFPVTCEPSVSQMGLFATDGQWNVGLDIKKT